MASWASEQILHGPFTKIGGWPTIIVHPAEISTSTTPPAFHRDQNESGVSNAVIHVRSYTPSFFARSSMIEDAWKKERRIRNVLRAKKRAQNWAKWIILLIKDFAVDLQVGSLTDASNLLFTLSHQMFPCHFSSDEGSWTCKTVYYSNELRAKL